MESEYESRLARILHGRVLEGRAWENRVLENRKQKDRTLENKDLAEVVAEMQFCQNWQAARSQRAQERARGLDDSGTSGYEQMGCYECDGKNKNCSSYLILDF